MKKALLIIDMLYDFISQDGALSIPKGNEIIPHIKREINKARQENYVVIYVCDAHEADDKEFEIWPKHSVKGTKGAEIINDLSPTPEDVVVEKTTYSGFFKTELEVMLKKYYIDTLITTGVATNICVLYTAADARMRGYDVIVPADCTCALTDDDYNWAIKQMKETLRCKII